MCIHAHHVSIKGVAVLCTLAGPRTNPSTKPQHFGAKAKMPHNLPSFSPKMNLHVLPISPPK